jgi:hypothetical protein
MRHNQRDGFHIFDWPDREDLYITAICDAVPGIVVDRYLVNTSFDSGTITLSDDEVSNGWFMVGDFAHSPRIQSIDDIPHDQFDEWLVFERPTRVSNYESFVSYGGFNPIDFSWEEKLKQFWHQVTRFQPESVLGENHAPYVLTRNEGVAQKLLNNPAIK